MLASSVGRASGGLNQLDSAGGRALQRIELRFERAGGRGEGDGVGVSPPPSRNTCLFVCVPPICFNVYRIIWTFENEQILFCTWVHSATHCSTVRVLCVGVCLTPSLTEVAHVFHCLHHDRAFQIVQVLTGEVREL